MLVFIKTNQMLYRLDLFSFLYLHFYHLTFLRRYLGFLPVAMAISNINENHVIIWQWSYDHEKQNDNDSDCMCNNMFSSY